MVTVCSVQSMLCSGESGGMPPTGICLTLSCLRLNSVTILAKLQLAALLISGLQFQFGRLR